jgi:hypothetical protein
MKLPLAGKSEAGAVQVPGASVTGATTGAGAGAGVTDVTGAGGGVEDEPPPPQAASTLVANMHAKRRKQVDTELSGVGFMEDTLTLLFYPK